MATEEDPPVQPPAAGRKGKERAANPPPSADALNGATPHDVPRPNGEPEPQQPPSLVNGLFRALDGAAGATPASKARRERQGSVGSTHSAEASQWMPPHQYRPLLPGAAGVGGSNPLEEPPQEFASLSDSLAMLAAEGAGGNDSGWDRLRSHINQGSLQKPPFAEDTPAQVAEREKKQTWKMWVKVIDNFYPKLKLSRDPPRNTDANAENAKQALKATERNTIWNAVVYAHTKEGRQSWKKATQGKDEWMTGQDRGVMGETPLHAAVLCCRTNYHEEVLHKLWDGYPALRTCVYEEDLYKGENVLHIAIVRKLKRSIIEKFVESREGKTLMAQRADGLFFKRAELSDGCCNYGEFPLAFAACTNQREVFDYLVTQGAPLNFQTNELYNLLHLMVLHSVHQHAREKEEGGVSIMYGTDTAGAKDDTWCRVMYDHIQEHMERDGCYPSMCTQESFDRHTPLTLAACKGSLQMFNHLFNKLMSIEWTFGPVTCRKLYLLGVDVPLDDEAGEHSRSVLEVVVESERLDILTEGYLKKILDAKWDKYAKRMFRSRFWWAVAFAFNLIFVSSIDTGGSIHYELLIVSAECFLAMLYFKEFIRELRRLRANGAHAYLNTNRAHVFERMYALFTTPICVLIVLLRWHSCRNFLLNEYGNATARAATLDLNKPWTIQFRHSCRRHNNWALAVISKCLLLIQSFLSFLNLFRGMMGFPEYGHFVLMLIQMLQHDMRKFCAIYAIFLFGFAHLLYISCDLTNTGYFPFLYSMRIGFQAALQQVDLDMEKDKNYQGVSELSFWTKQLVLAIILCNFFLVSLVLVNLLIAMMSSTYEDINSAAKRQWNLVRARIITNLDKEMSADERKHPNNNYWECEGEEKNDARFMTFTSSENREEYLRNQAGLEQIEQGAGAGSIDD